MSGGIVLPFRRPERRAGAPVPRARAHGGLAVVLQVRGETVELLADGWKLVMPPAMARALADDLLELADDAEVRRG